MTKKEIENRLAELKMDYVRIQDDLEKAGTAGADTSSAEKVLTDMETEMASLRKQLRELP